MKSLEKDRGRRYDSAAGLARDVERYPSDEPVEACLPTLGYRLRKCCRKNRAAIVTALLFAALLIAATLVSIWQASRAVVTKAIAARERAAAVAAHDAEAARQAEAVAAGQKAQQERDAAKAARDDLRRALYAASLNLIAAVWKEDNVPRIIELLDDLRPKPGEEDLRGFEWHYWDRLAHAARRTWAFHAGDSPVGAVLSADARRVASWSFTEGGGKLGFRVRVADTATGRELLAVTLPRDDRAVLVSDGRLAFNRDGTRLAFTRRINDVIRPDGRVVVYDVDDKRVVFREDGPFDRKTALSPDGTRLAVAGYVVRQAGATRVRGPESITVRDLSDPDWPPVVVEWNESVGTLTDAPRFSPDGSRLAAVTTTGSPGGRVLSALRVWDTATGAQVCL